MPKTAMAGGTQYNAAAAHDGAGRSNVSNFNGAAKQGVNFVHPQQPTNSRNAAIEHAMSAQQLPS